MILEGGTVTGSSTTYPRNASILINVNRELKPRNEAVVSVFDSGFMLGDGVWEGLRVHRGKAAFLDRHLDRLFEGAKAIAMDVGLSLEELVKRLYDTLDANGMSEGVHVRLMITRGVRATPTRTPGWRSADRPSSSSLNRKEPDPAIHERGLKPSRCTCVEAIQRCKTRKSTPIRSSTASSRRSSAVHAGGRR